MDPVGNGSSEIHEYFVPHNDHLQLHYDQLQQRSTSGRFGLSHLSTFQAGPAHMPSPPHFSYTKVLLIELTLEDYDDPLGFSISGGTGKSSPFVISHIAAGSVAEIGGLKVGDQILEINNVRLRDFSPFDAVRFIRECSSHSATVLVKVQRRKLAIAKGLGSYTTYSLDPSDQSDQSETTEVDEVFQPEIEFEEDLISRGSMKYSSVSSMGSSDWDDSSKDQFNTTPRLPRQSSTSYLLEDDMAEMTHMLDVKETNDVTEATKSVAEYLKRSAVFQLEVESLESLFKEEKIQNAVGLSSAIDRHWCVQPHSNPQSDSATVALEEILTEIDSNISQIAGEVQQFFSRPHFAAMLNAHDQIARQIFDLERFHDGFTAEKLGLKETTVGVKPKSSAPKTPSSTVVLLQKQHETPLGVTVKKDHQAVIVSRVVKGGTAEQAGSLHEGDEILEVNDIKLADLTIDEVATIMSELEGTVFLKILPKREVAIDTVPLDTQTQYVRAMFDYDPTKDITHPCQELGLKFRKRDVLRLVDTTDLNWWQGNIEGVASSLPGLIPSALHQKKRMNKNRSMKHQKSKSGSGHFGDFTLSLRRGLSQSAYASYQSTFDVVPYEEVVMYRQDPLNKRPIIITGADQCGAEELFWKLMDEHPDKFITPLIYTTKLYKSGTNRPNRLQTTSKEKFKKGIANERFVEWKLDHHFYGLTHHNLINAQQPGLVRLVHLKPESLSAIRNATYMPYVVCVVPPPFVRFSLNLRWSNPTIKDKEIHQIMEQSADIEKQYGELFDRVITNYELEHASDDLLKITEALDSQPQWIPRKWLQDPMA